MRRASSRKNFHYSSVLIFLRNVQRARFSMTFCVDVDMTKWNFSCIFTGLKIANDFACDDNNSRTFSYWWFVQDHGEAVFKNSHASKRLVTVMMLAIECDGAEAMKSHPLARRASYWCCSLVLSNVERRFESTMCRIVRQHQVHLN